MLWYLADLCLDIYFSEFAYENINIFLSNDHIWNYRKFKQSYLLNPLTGRYFIQILRIFYTLLTTVKW